MTPRSTRQPQSAQVISMTPQQRPNPARNCTRRHHGPDGAARFTRSIARLHLARRSTQRKHTPTSGCPSSRSRLAMTSRSPQHQQPDCGRSTESPPTAVLSIRKNLDLNLRAASQLSLGSPTRRWTACGAARRHVAHGRYPRFAGTMPGRRVRDRRVDGTGPRPIIAVGRWSVSTTRTLRARRIRTDRQCSRDRFTPSGYQGLVSRTQGPPR